MMSDSTSETNAGVEIASGRAKETMFRVAARNQIELIAIADNKANMILGISSILISVIVALFGSGFAVQGIHLVDKIELVIPLVVLMLTCVASAVFAVVAAKPHIIKSRKGMKLSFLFFQNYYRKSLDQYMEEMYEVLGSRQNTYDQLIIDMYNNGRVLHRKYRQLSISYTIFLIGIVISAVGSLTLLLI